MLFLLPVARAASVAVLDFDAQGPPYPTAASIAEGVRQAFVDERLLDPLSPRDIADVVPVGRENQLRLARQKAAEAGRAQADGDPERCAALAEEAANLHTDAASELGRRAEVADALYLQGMCLQAAGHPAEAWFAFAEVVRQYPGYLADRAQDVTPEGVEALASAQAAADSGSPRVRSADWLADAGRTLAVDYVVTGLVDRRGKVTARLYEGGTLLAEAQATVRFPVGAADPAYGLLARQLADGAGLLAAAPVVEEPRAVEPEPVVRDDPPPRPPEREQTAPDRGPVARRWWVWVGAAVLVGGGAAAVAVATSGTTPDPIQEPPTWSVHVPTD